METVNSNNREPEADTAAGRDSSSSLLEKKFDEELDRRHCNHARAMRDACKDIKSQLRYAIEEGEEELLEMNYSSCLTFHVLQLIFAI